MRHLGTAHEPSAHMYVAPNMSRRGGGGGGDAANYPSSTTPPPSPHEAFMPGSGFGMYGGGGDMVVKVPRRVQLLNFWASTRVVQRLIMVRNLYKIICRLYSRIGCIFFVTLLITKSGHD